MQNNKRVPYRPLSVVYAFYKREAVNRFVGDKSVDDLNAWVENIVKRTTTQK